MERFYLWPSAPLTSLIVLLLFTQAFLYAARVPMHRALRSLGRALGGGLRLVSRACKSTAVNLGLRNRELLLATGRAELEGKIAKEFQRIEGSFTKELAGYPAIHRQMHDLVTKLDGDYKECQNAPPSPPGWSQAVAAVTAMPRDGDRAVQKILEEIQKSAVASEKKAIGEYRDSTAERHKILGKMAGAWKELLRLLDDTGKSVGHALESTRRIDGYMKSYDEVRKGEPAAARTLGWEAVRLFLVSSLVMAIAFAGAFVNFQLIALPMSELVPSGTRLLGVPVSTIAALVIVLMEVAAGVFLMDSLGITNLFPKLEQLPASRRRIVLGVSFFALLFLASVESSLAVLREQIVEADSALKATLAGSTGEAVTGAASSSIPVIGQAVLGFILPWILAMVAIPLEMLVACSGPVGLSVGGGALYGAGVLARILASTVRWTMETLRWIYDVAIILPLQIERLVLGHTRSSPVKSLADDHPIRNPADRTVDGRRNESFVEDGGEPERKPTRMPRRSIQAEDSNPRIAR